MRVTKTGFANHSQVGFFIRQKVGRTQKSLEKWVLNSDLVIPITNETIQVLRQSSARMSSQEQSEGRKQTVTFSGCQEEGLNDTISTGASSSWKHTPMGRWERERVEEEPWNVFAVVNTNSRWREILDTIRSTKGRSNRVGGNTK